MFARQSYDVVIVGARCAGAATALLLARRGLRVLVLDRGVYGSDMLSTHALMRGAVVQLHRWGVLSRIIDAGTPVVTRTTFDYGDETRAVAVKSRDGVPGLFAPRRALLDRLLVDAAVAAGAEVVHETRVTALSGHTDGRVSGVQVMSAAGVVRELQSRIVIGADGLRSTVARLAGARVYRRARHATGVVYGYWDGLEADGYRWCFRPGVATGIIPTNDGRCCVFVCVPAHTFRTRFAGGAAEAYHDLLRVVSPEVAERIAGREPAEPLRGFGGEPGYFRESAGPGWALVGDAGYFKDPLTAHGITDALRDAELLADAVAEGTDWALSAWPAQRDALSAALFETTDRIASFEWTLPELRVLHDALIEEMAAEVRAMTAPRSAAGALLASR